MALTGGNVTVGTAGTYATWTAMQADLAAQLTSDLTVTQISDTAGEAMAVVQSLDVQGHSVVLTCSSPHGGDPTAGYKSDVTGDNWIIWLRFSDGIGGGSAEIKNLRSTRSGAGGAHGAYRIETDIDTDVHDIIIDVGGVSANGMYVYTFSVAVVGKVIHVWNVVVARVSANFSYPLSVNNSHGATMLAENCTARNEGGNFGLDFQDCTARNCCSFGTPVQDFICNGTCTGYNNASQDATATNPGQWAGGTFNSVDSIVPADEFESIDITNADGFKVKAGGSCEAGGATPGIAENTLGIRGNARPHPADVSIGADEFPSPAPSGGGGSGSSGGGMMSAIMAARHLGYMMVRVAQRLFGRKVPGGGLA